MIGIASERRNSCAGPGMYGDRHAPQPSLVIGLALNVLSIVRTWRERDRFRRELAARSNRELQDIGVCQADIADEVGKPFWRA